MVPEPVLEALLERELGIPTGGPVECEGQLNGRCAALPTDELEAALERLRIQVVGLQSAAERVGQIPVNYPRHVELIMRAVSALLPWYTRPIREFSTAACGVAMEMGGVIQLLSRQTRTAPRALRGETPDR